MSQPLRVDVSPALHQAALLSGAPPGVPYTELPAKMIEQLRLFALHRIGPNAGSTRAVPPQESDLQEIIGSADRGTGWYL